MKIINIVIFLAIFLTLPHANSSTGQGIIYPVLPDYNIASDLNALADVSDNNWIHTHGNQLRVGIPSRENAPFYFITGGAEFDGIVADELLILKKLLNIDIKLVSFDSEEQAIEALRKKEIDLVSFTNDKVIANYPDLKLIPYLHSYSAIYTYMGKLQDIDLTKTKRIYFSGEIPQLNPSIPANIMRFSRSYEKALSSSIDKMDTAYIGEVIKSNYLIINNFNSQLTLNKIVPRSNISFGYVSLKENTELIALIERALSTLSKCQQVLVANRWGAGLECDNDSFINSLTPEEKKYLADNKYIDIGISEDMAPLTFFDKNNRFNGIVSDVLDDIRRNTGINFVIHRYESTYHVTAAMDAKQLKVSFFSATSERKKNLSFTRPIAVSPHMVIVKKEMPSSAVIGDSNLKILSVPRDHPLIKLFEKNYKNVKIIQSKTVAESLSNVREGVADFAITPEIIGQYYLAYKYSNSLKKLHKFEDETLPFTFVTAKSDPILFSILEKALLQISPNDMATFNRRWWANSATDDKYWDGLNAVFYKSLSALLVLLIVVLCWVVYLKHRIAKKMDQRIKIQTKLAFVQNLINSIPQPIYVRDKNLELTASNEAYARFFSGLSNHSQGELNAERLLLISLENKFNAIYQKVMKSGVGEAQDETLELEGEIFHWYHWVQPLHDEDHNTIGVVAGWLDIAPRLKIIEELNQARDSAVKANRTKSIFLATVSHEIRNPMNAIIGMLELALTRKQNLEENYHAIEVAYDSSKYLLQVISELIDLSVIESGKVTVQNEQLNLSSLIKPIVDVFSGLAKNKNLELICDLSAINDINVMIDGVKLKKIVSNILSNAIKFTSFGHVLIRTEVSDNPQGKVLLLSIEDSGRGMDDNELHSLFTPFSQIRILENNGTGLGMSICKSLTDLMGGQLDVQSIKGQGSCFTLTLPLDISNKESSVTESVILTQLSQRKGSLNVLIVEDHLPSQMMLQQQVEYLGHIPYMANDGMEGLALWQKNSIDLIISDCNMPRLDGYGLARKIRTFESQMRIQPSMILGLTSNAQHGQEEMCLSAGMDAYFVKPINLAMLSRYLPKLLSGMPDIPDRIDGAFLQNIPCEKRFEIGMKFIETNKVDIIDLEFAVISKNSDDILSIAHRIKGVGRFMGYVALIEKCELLENMMVGDIDFAQIHQILEELKVITRDLNSVIEELI